MFSSKILKHAYKFILIILIYELFSTININDVFPCSQYNNIFFKTICLILAVYSASLYISYFTFLPHVYLFTSEMSSYALYNDILEQLILIIQVITSFSISYFISKHYKLGYKSQLFIAYLTYVFIALAFTILFSKRGI